MRTLVALGLFTAALLSSGAYAADALAIPLPDTGSAAVPLDTQLHARLAVAGVDRADAVTLAQGVCGILRADPTAAGKLAAREYLTGAGVAPGFSEGWTLGTAVDVYCPEMIPAVR